MKYRNLFWGVILVFLGILGLLDNFNVIYFSWHKLWNLWPVFLILWGISVLPVKNMLKMSFVIITLAFTMFYITQEAVDDEDHNFNWGTHVIITDDDDDDEPDADDTTMTSSYSSVSSGQGTFLIPYPENIKVAVLDLDAVAGEFILKNTTSNLTTFKITDSYLARKYTYHVKTEDAKAKINISTKKHTNIDLDGHDATAYLKLNENPVWDINLNAGAAEIDMDFSPFKVKKLSIDAGAASIDVKLGNKMPVVTVDIDAGAAEITVRIPKEADCEVDIDTFLSDKDLDGFVKRNGKYYTENYGQSDIKFKITIDSAISDLNIVRY